MNHLIFKARFYLQRSANDTANYSDISARGKKLENNRGVDKLLNNSQVT